MLINKLIRPSVGADLSRPPPIYRPSVPFHRILIISLTAIIAPIADVSALGGFSDVQIIL